MRRIFSLLGIFLMGALLACVPEKATIPPASAGEPIRSAPAAKEGWEAEWEKALTEAKREGKVLVYTSWSPEERDAISKGFKEKAPGITLQIVSGRGNELAEKVLREKRAGLHLADLIIGGSTTLLMHIKHAGVAETLLPQLILPRVSDPKQWWEDQLPFIDQEKQVFRAQTGIGGLDKVTINRTMINKGEIQSSKALLNPGWKGKIGMEDPSLGGMQYVFMVGYDVLGADYWKELAKNVAAITRDKRQVVEWVARGKYPIIVSGSNDTIREYERAGASIETLVFPIGKAHMSGKRSNIALLRDRPHPASTKVFLNWLLSKDIQEAWSIATEKQSGRKDVSTAHIPQFELYQPGMEYIDIDSEEYIQKRTGYERLAKEIFSEFLK